MGIGLTKIKHVKIPVTDVQRSVTWYQSLLDLELYMEFVEQGVVRGASLLDRDGGYEIALRDREVCASRPSLAGFDVFALAASSRGRRTPVSGRRRASARGSTSATRMARWYVSCGGTLGRLTASWAWSTAKTAR